MVAEIFLSYSSADRERVRPLVEVFQACGWSVWWDRDITIGDNFDDAIEEAINAAKCVVVVWTEESAKSRWVRNEAMVGQDRGCLVPVVLDDVDLPIAFKAVHNADLRHGNPKEVLEAVGQVLNKPLNKLPQSTVSFSPTARKWFTPWLTTVSIVVVVVVAVIFTVVFTNESNSLQFEARDWVLITDFENATGDELFDHALATAFQVGLEQSTHINVVPPDRVAETLSRMQSEGATIDEAVGLEISRREGIAGLVVPAISKVANEFALTVRLVNPETGTAVRSYMEVAQSPEEILITLEKLIVSLRRELGESRTDIALRGEPLPAVTTPSLEALDLYSRGNRLWTDGQAQESEALLLSALSIDPDFAMAHSSLGEIYSSYFFNDYEKAQFHFTRALELSERATQREFMITRTTALDFDGETEEALASYRAFLEVYPDVSWVRYNMANLLRRNGQHKEAERQYRMLADADPMQANVLVNLATTLRLLERFDEAVEYFEQAFAIQPQWKLQTVLNHEFGFLLIQNDDLASARELFETAVDNEGIAAEGLRSLAILELWLGHFVAANELLKGAAQANSARGDSLSEARDYLFLAGSLADLEQHQKALIELDRAYMALDALNAQPWMKERIAVLFARLGAIDRAESIAIEIEQYEGLTTSDNAARRVRGEIAVARGEIESGLELLELAYEQSGSLLALDSIASAHEIAGNTAAAISLYRELIDRRDYIGWEGQRVWFSAHLSLAQALVEIGSADEALAVIDTLINQWADADEEAPMVITARQLHATLSE